MPPPGSSLVEWLFVRLLGFIYLVAFVSWGVQASGLVGRQGILPAGEYLNSLRRQLGKRGYWRAPTIFWLNSSDGAIKLACVAGVVLALVLISGYAQRAALILLYLLYLSLVYTGQIFLGYQWDVLLLESGFLAIFLGISPTVTWLFRWLLFRLMFLSGAIKLLSRDETWRNLTALKYHYETQPLPTPLAWHMHKLPENFQKFSVLFTFLAELLIPFLIFPPWPLRGVAAIVIVSFQILIFLTGNYTFFNLLTISLCLFLVDDKALLAWLPGLAVRTTAIEATATVASLAGNIIADVLGFVVLLISGFQLFSIFGGKLSKAASIILDRVAPLRIVNTYGLFAVMTTVRPEIVIEGSIDGEDWLEYEFKYKPGDLKRAPRWVAPHQPRLDWQMWFAALRTYHANPWFVNLVVRLLEGSTQVLALLQKNPFPQAPPRYIRARLYDYHFSDFASRRSSAIWWRRELLGDYLPPISLTFNSNSS